MASVTRDMVRDKNPITLSEIFNASSNCHNFSGPFMTEDTGSLFYPVPLHNICAADSRSLHLHKNFITGYPGFRTLLTSYITIPVVNGYLLYNHPILLY